METHQQRGAAFLTSITRGEGISSVHFSIEQFASTGEKQAELMIDGLGSRMTDAGAYVLLGRIQMTESGLGGTWRRKEGATLCRSCSRANEQRPREKQIHHFTRSDRDRQGSRSDVSLLFI